jgi:adenosylhomocysteine nucleosidase
MQQKTVKSMIGPWPKVTQVPSAWRAGDAPRRAVCHGGAEFAGIGGRDDAGSAAGYARAVGRIAIAAAMQQELGALLAAMPDEAPVVLAGREFWLGHLDGQDVVVVLSRVGKVAAAMTATLLVHEFGAERAIFTGTAGGLHESARVGDVVVASALLQHDMDASPLFPRHEVPLYGTDRFVADASLSAALAAAARSVLADASRDDPALAGDAFGLDGAALCAFAIDAPEVRTGLVVSGDRFVASAAEGAALRERLPDALAVEMEGAALAQVCHDLGVPFAVVRTISDRADNSAHVDFGRFVESIASRYSVAIVRRFLRAWRAGAPS